MRFEVETNLYNPSALAKKFSSIQTNFDVTLGKISAILSDSEIQEYLDGHTTMNTRLSSVIQDVDGVHTQISSMRTDYEDGFQSVDSRLTTIDETINGIHAEVSSVHREYNGLETRISSAEAKITDNAIVATVRSSESYKGDLASKNATFTGDYVPTTSNVPASSWNTTALKESHLNDTFLTSGGELYQYISGHNGLMITFSSDSKTEATRYDYVRIYYKIGDITYVLPDIGGTDISGASVFVPSNEFWLYWRSDRSQVYYGFRIASIEWVFSNTPTLTEATLPGIDPTPMSGTNYPETTHPYTNNEEKFWKYTHTGHSASVNPSYGWAKREDSGIRTLTERMSAAELKITDSAIVSTVRSSAAYTGDLAGKTSSADVESIIEQKADSIRLKADKISWQSTYSSMTENGVLTCTGANINGNLSMIGTNHRCIIGSQNVPKYNGYSYSITNSEGFLIKKFNGNNLRSIRYIGCPQDNIQDVTCSGASTAVRTITLTNTGNIADDYTYNSSTDNNFVERIYYNSNGMPSYNIELSSGKITSGSPYGGLHINSGGISMGNGSGSVMSSSSGGVNGELMFRSSHGMVYITTNYVHLLRTNSSSTSTSEWTGGFSYYPKDHSFQIGSYSDSNQQLRGWPPNTYLAFCGRSVQLSGGSSERFKHDIKDLVSEGLNPHKLLFLKPKQFIYNDDYPIEYMDMKDKLIPGFIAEDVAEIYPSALIHDELDGTIKNWDVRRIVPGMLSLIQELYEKIEDLERRL